MFVENLSGFSNTRARVLSLKKKLSQLPYLNSATMVVQS